MSLISGSGPATMFVPSTVKAAIPGDDIVVDYVTKGLQAGNKCACVVDTAYSARERIPRELVSREGI
jgi:hypothetical protein